MNYRYELIVSVQGNKIKRFIGNDKNILAEVFEQWCIKSSTPREDMDIYIGEIQHKNN